MSGGVMMMSFEGKLEAFLGEAKFEMQMLFIGDRFPNVEVTARRDRSINLAINPKRNGKACL